MAENDYERTEAPTPRKRQEARQDGQVARSTDLTAACTLLAAVVLLQVFGLQLLGAMKLSVETMLTGGVGPNPTRADNVTGTFSYVAQMALAGAAPLVLSILAVTLLAAVSQVGVNFTLKPLAPNFGKLSPLRGFKNMVSAQAAMRLLMSLLKVALIGGVAAWAIITDLPRILMLPALEVRQLFAAACGLIYSLSLKLAALLLVLGVADYFFQRSRHMVNLRMTKQEVKEELKRMEGDPLVKQRRTRVARQLALQRIGQQVPSADVVVTNPTHYAVALRYDGDTMRAPKVIAKGADFLAMRIRQLAIANGVPLVERKELAQALYRAVDPGQEVPPQFYNAVAEILAYVYRLSGRRSA